MKKYWQKYGGIFLGAIYGLCLRLLFDAKLDNIDFADLFSVTFIWIVPVVLGIIPLIWIPSETIQKPGYRMAAPCLTVFLFFCFCFLTRLEDIICLFIISIPFLAGAAFAGFVFSLLLLHYRKKKGILYSILLIPFFTGLLEEQFPTPVSNYQVSTSVIINATPEKIWTNVTSVPMIQEQEYNKGMFNYAGIPRPLYAVLSGDSIGAIRIGHFEGGLVFKETVSEWSKNQRIVFDIRVIPGSIRYTIFDQHILKGNHFKFLSAAYELKPVNKYQTELVLKSWYQLDTKNNYYGALWGNALLRDFQERLLHVIKNRCDE